jgi:hypothetical protein
MQTSFWTISGWLFALLSLIVNFLQLRKNKKLKENVISLKQNASGNSHATQQHHSGNGDNINAGGNLNLKK